MRRFNLLEIPDGCIPAKYGLELYLQESSLIIIEAQTGKHRAFVELK